MPRIEIHLKDEERKQLEAFAPVITIYGYQTSVTRKHLGLTKNKADKSKAEFNSHAVDGVAIAASRLEIK